MMLPTLHLNGTSKKDIYVQLTNVANALDNVLDKMSDAAPHGRDYYVNDDPDAFRKAAAEHLVRVKRVTELRDEYVQMLIEVFAG